MVITGMDHNVDIVEVFLLEVIHMKLAHYKAVQNIQTQQVINVVVLLALYTKT